MSRVPPGRGALLRLRQIDAKSTGAEGITSAIDAQSGASAANAMKAFRMSRFTEVSMQCGGWFTRTLGGPAQRRHPLDGASGRPFGGCGCPLKRQVLRVPHAGDGATAQRAG